MRSPRSANPSAEALLNQIRTELASYRSEHGKKHLPPWLASRIARLITEGGLSRNKVSVTLGIHNMTLSRWVEKESGKPVCRELALVPEQRVLTGVDSGQIPLVDRALLHLPNGLYFNIPMSGLTAAFVSEILAVSGSESR